MAPVADTKQAAEGQRHQVKVVVRVRPALQKVDCDSLWVQVQDSNTLCTVNHKNTDEALQYEWVFTKAR